MEPDAFASQNYELLDFQVQGERVLTRQRTVARGVGSGIEMQIDSLTLWMFNDEGKVTRLEVFTLHEEGAALRVLQAG